MKVTPYLNFDGNCREALEAYARILGGRITMIQTMGESPMGAETPEEQKDKIIHARLELDDQVVMASDAPPGNYFRPQGLFISIQAADASEADRVYNALSDGGQIIMEIQKTFWAERFAMFTDKWGTPWMVNADS